MMKYIVTTAARYAVLALNGLAERIDRAGQKVAKAQLKSKRGLSTATVGKASAKHEDYDRLQKLDGEVSKAVLNKINTARSKDMQHNVPTGRHH